mmetsp:Transcript_39472/g.92214  ORF Transcript_39472/g.92214 Transcript_39472/m.92214 type:complete len:360 (-) Transcript_39472:2099-3178(-)
MTDDSRSVVLSQKKMKLTEVEKSIGLRNLPIVCPSPCENDGNNCESHTSNMLRQKKNRTHNFLADLPEISKVITFLNLRDRARTVATCRSTWFEFSPERAGLEGPLSHGDLGYEGRRLLRNASFCSWIIRDENNSKLRALLFNADAEASNLSWICRIAASEGRVPAVETLLSFSKVDVVGMIETATLNCQWDAVRVMQRNARVVACVRPCSLKEVCGASLGVLECSLHGRASTRCFRRLCRECGITEDHCYICRSFRCAACASELSERALEIGGDIIFVNCAKCRRMICGSTLPSFKKMYKACFVQCAHCKVYSCVKCASTSGEDCSSFQSCNYCNVGNICGQCWDSGKVNCGCMMYHA